MLRSKSLVLVLALLGLGSLAEGQYVPISIIGEGQPSPDTGDNIVTLIGQHNVTSTGQIAVELDDAGPTATDDFFWVDGLALHRAGGTVTGSASPTDFVDNFDTYSHLNDALQLVWVGDNATGDFLALDGDGLLFDGDPAPGIPGRVLNDYNEPCIDAAGNIYFRADLDGTTTDDEVIYFIPFGGSAVPLDLGIGTGIFQEGQLIIGGPLDGQSWDDAATFVGLECSDSGVLLMEADVETSIEVLIRKQPGMTYELLVSEGDMFMAAGGMAPIENINQISQARGNLNWAIDAKFDDTVTSTTADDVILADVGAGIQIIAEEGMDIAAITGIPGTTLGFLSQVSVNTSGKIIYLGDIQDDGVNIPPYSEAIFMWDAGVTTLIITDEILIPTSGGTLTNLELDLYINDQDRIFFQGDDGTADTVFEAFLPTVFSVENLMCMSSVAGTEIEASWTIPAGQVYDGIRIFENGLLAATLGGGELTYTSSTFMQNINVTIEVEPFVGMDDAPRAACSGFVVLPPDFVECRTPMPPLPIDSVNPPQMDTLSVMTNVALQDLTISINITHTFQGDLDMDLTSPLGTNVVLTTDNGGALDNVDITFADFGDPISTTTDLASGGVVTPEGPGTMADFQCENSSGDWILGYDDDAGGDTGTLDMWCLNIYEEPNPGLNCCPRPTMLSCANVGACGGPGVNLAWQNNDMYNALELVRDDGMTQMTIALGATDTSFSDTTVVDGMSYTYTLRYQCSAGGLLQDSESCSVAVNLTDVPEVQSLVCAPDACGTGNVILTWANGAMYDSLTLNRGGVFLATVTGLTTFTDTMPNAGASTYQLVADCGGSTADVTCVVDLSPPPVTDLMCVADFCGNNVALTWNDNGVMYDTLTLERGGVFLADVTGMTSFVDLTPLAGTATYSVVGDCNGSTSAETCAVDNSLTLPDDLACGAPLGSDTVTLTWTNPLTYDSIEIQRDGVLVSPQPGPSDESYMDVGLAQGAYAYTVTFSCAGGSDSLTCTAGVLSGDQFLLIPTDGTTEGINAHDPNTGAHIAQIVNEDATGSTTQIFVATNAILGPRVAGGDPLDRIIYLADQTGLDNGSVHTYELDGSFIGEVVDDAVYDDVRGIEFQGDTLFLTSALDDQVVSFDIGTQMGTTYITGPQPTDLLFLADGSLLVGDWTTDTVTLYDPSGLNPVVLVDSMNSTIDNPNQIAALANGNYIVGTEGSDEIIEFTLAGTVVQSFAVGFNVQGVYQLPTGLVLFTTDDGTGVYTLDLTSGMITNIYDDGAVDFYYIELAELGGDTGPSFSRGDCNADGNFNIADSVFLLGNLFPPPGGMPNMLACEDACDGNDDGALNIADAVSLLGALFPPPGSPPPSLPDPFNVCGEDPTDTDPLGRMSFPPCP